MADAVEAAKGAVDLQTKAVELIDQLTAGLKAVAPQMADVTLAAIRFQGVVDLVSSVVLLGTAGGCLIVLWRIAPRVIKAWDNVDSTFVAVGGMLASIFLTIGGAVSAVGGLSGLCSASMWAAIVDPRLALALRVINRLM